MISKYNGTCCYCGEPTQAGIDEYDMDTRKSYHVECQENQPPSAEDFAKAERLGFIKYSQDMPTEGLLQRMTRKEAC